MIDLTNLSWIDYAIAGIILLSAVISLVRGFVREAISLITWVGAFFLALSFKNTVALLLTPYISHETLRLLVAFIIILISILIIGAMINFFFSQLVRKTGLSGTDRVLGIGFGITRGALMISILLLLMGLTTFPQTPWWQTSIIIPYFEPLIHWLQTFFPQLIYINVTQ